MSLCYLDRCFFLFGWFLATLEAIQVREFLRGMSHVVGSRGSVQDRRLPGVNTLCETYFSICRACPEAKLFHPH